MLCMMYWELNEDMSAEERLSIADQLMSSGMFPPEGAEVLGWWTTPDNWGILLVEAETEAAAFDSLNLWRVAGKGFFKFTKSAPAMAVRESVAHGMELIQRLTEN